MTPGMRANAKQFGLLPVAHDLFATATPFSDDPNAPPVEEIDPSEWTRGMKNVAEFSHFLAEHLLQRPITVYIVKALGNGCAAAYGPGTLYFSLKGLGRKWFDHISPEVEELIIHEFGHEWAKNHLSEDYHKALCKLAVRYRKLALEKPDALKGYLGSFR
jgi:hypothetical protein